MSCTREICRIYRFLFNDYLKLFNHSLTSSFNIFGINSNAIRLLPMLSLVCCFASLPR